MGVKVCRMIPVQSGMVHKLGFDPSIPGAGYGYLVVQFTNLKAYCYQNVAYVDYLVLLNSLSIGAAFNLLIKKQYKGEILSFGDDVVQKAELTEPPVPTAKEQEQLLMTDLLDTMTPKKAKK